LVLRSEIHIAIRLIVKMKHDVINKTGNTSHIAVTPEEGQAMAIGNIHKEIW